MGWTFETVTGSFCIRECQEFGGRSEEAFDMPEHVLPSMFSISALTEAMMNVYIFDGYHNDAFAI